MEGFNTFEYSQEQKCEGKWVLFKVLLILGYVLFAAAYFTVIFITRIIPLGALIPLFLWILIFLTWKYLSPDYRYTVEAGTLSFYVSYSAKKKSREAKTAIKLSEAKYILPAAEACEAVREFAPTEIYSGVPSKSATDVYVILYNERNGKKCALYIVAPEGAQRLFKRHNPRACGKC